MKILVCDEHMIQGRFVEMAVNQNTVFIVQLGMFVYIGLDITSRRRVIPKTSNKPLHNRPP